MLLRAMDVTQAQAKYLDAAEKFGSMRDRVEGLLSTREDAYLGLLAVPDQSAPFLGDPCILLRRHASLCWLLCWFAVLCNANAICFWKCGRMLACIFCAWMQGLNDCLSRS